MLRLGSYQAIARGSDSVMFFQWRASRAGYEKFHSAMLPHGGPTTRGFQEVVALGRELPRVSAVVGGRIRSDVALLWDFDAWAALEGPVHPLSRSAPDRSSVTLVGSAPWFIRKR